MNVWPLKPALVILTVGAALSLPVFLPALDRWPLLEIHLLAAVLEFPIPKGWVPAAPELPLPRLPAGPLKPYRDPTAIFDEKHTLDPFYEALLRVDAKNPGRVVRILHYGDSPVTADLITADARRLLQQRFGSAGHGFCLIARPWAWYGHDSVRMSSSGWDLRSAMDFSRRDGVFGIGGVRFSGGPGASASYTLREGHTEVEVAWRRRPEGGVLAVAADGEPLGEIDTYFPEPGSGFTKFPLPAAAKRVDLRVAHGEVQLFGVSFRRPGPGVQYDSLGLNGASMATLSSQMNESHWTGQLRHYRPDLMIVNYGSNESQYPPYVGKPYERDLRHTVEKVRRALPGTPFLLMSPMDRGQRDGGEIVSDPALVRLVTIQERVAEEMGVAFFNTFAAMGGAGTMGRWYEATPRLISADLLHPTPAGAKVVGQLLNRALLNGLNQYKLRKLTGSGMGSEAIAKGGSTN